VLVLVLILVLILVLLLTCRAVNPAAVPHQAEVVKREALDAVLIGGTTDEWPSQSLAERVAIAKAWRLAIPVGGAVKLILHTGANALGDARDVSASVAVAAKACSCCCCCCCSHCCCC